MGTSYWKSKVLPKIKKVFERNPTKKAAATEACKTFDESKGQYTKEFEEKKTELQPKVVEIYEASSVEIKKLVKERNEEAPLKKHSAQVQSFLDELVKIEFPGSKPVCEACSKFGAAYVSGPIFFVFEKVSTFVVTQDEKQEEEAAAAAATPTTTDEKAASSTTTTTAEEIIKEEKEVVVEEEKKEGAPPPVAAAAEKTEEVPPPPAESSAPTTTATAEPPKVEEAAPAAEPPKS